MAYILGITGGLSAGKTSAAQCLASDKTHIIEVDELARPLIQPGSVCYERLIEKFGKQICASDGSIIRQRLANAAFATPQKAQSLNEIFSSPLTEAIKLEIMQSRMKRAQLIIVVAAIMFEQGWDKLCHGVLNISAPESIRIERAIRKGLSEMDVLRRLASQLGEKDRMNKANWTIYTQQTIDDLCKKINKLAVENKWL